MAQNRKAPAFQEYAASMLAKTEFRLMNLAERGIYYTMRLECWENKRVPSSPDDLGKYIGMDISGAFTERVKSMFEEENGWLFCRELEDYRKHLEDRLAAQSKGGKKGAKITNTRFDSKSGETQVSRRDTSGSLVKLSSEKQNQVQSLENGIISNLSKENKEWINDYDNTEIQ